MHGTATTGNQRTRRVRARTRLHGHVLLLRRDRRRRVDRDHPSRDRARGDVPRHRRAVRTARQRGAARQGARGPPRRSDDRDEVRRQAERRRPRRAPARRHAGERAAIDRRLAEAPRHRPRRPLLPAPHRPGHADRGDRRRARRARAGGQDPSLSGSARRRRRRSAPPTPCTRWPPSRASTRSSRATSRTRCCRPLRELGIGLVAYSPLGRGFLSGALPLGRRARRRRLAPDPAALPGRQRRAQHRAGRPRWPELAAEKGVRARPARARVGARPGRRHRPDPGHQAPHATSSRTPARSTSSSPTRTSPGSATRSASPPGRATTRARCGRSTVDAALVAALEVAGRLGEQELGLLGVGVRRARRRGGRPWRRRR